jgi:hypothetical protein
MLVMTAFSTAGGFSALRERSAMAIDMAVGVDENVSGSVGSVKIFIMASRPLRVMNMVPWSPVWKRVSMNYKELRQQQTNQAKLKQKTQRRMGEGEKGRAKGEKHTKSMLFNASI